jgi:hypothetical protein
METLPGRRAAAEHADVLSRRIMVLCFVGQLEMRLDYVRDIDEECRRPLLAMVFDDKAETGGRTGAHATLGIAGADLDADLVAPERLGADRLQHVDAIDGAADRQFPKWITSRIPRAADGVITSYETRSTFICGRVKQARSPQTCNRMPYDISFQLFRLMR